MEFSVLFDLDGTLSDPKEGITRSLCHALSAMGLDARDPHSLSWCIGPPLQSSIPTLIGSDDPATCARCLELFRARFSTAGLFENALYPGIPSALEGLRAAGFRLFVATSKPTVYASRIVAHFELSSFFEGVYGAEMDGTRTRKSELIAFLLQAEALDPSRTIMVGDREHDVLGAAAHGIRTLGVLYGYGSREELLAAGAVAVCDSPGEIPGAVRELAGD